jgi:hypothetical protein
VALYEVTSTGLQRHAPGGFAALEIYERDDLQRFIRDQISALGEDLLVIAEEFGTWAEARRRIDLLALDRLGRLVVIEIKRTESGGHMELQAIRYAAMVSSMGFEEVVEAYAAHRTKQDIDDEDSRAELEAFLDASEEGGEPVISTDVRIILVSADFGREITTTVLWLNGFEGMDIRCVRLVPYEVDGKVMLDIQQVIPLPEAADYQVQLRKKGAARERARTSRRDLTRYHIIVDGIETPAENKRNAMRVMIEELTKRGASVEEIFRIIPNRGKILPGRHTDPDSLKNALREDDPSINLARWFADSPFVDEEVGKTYVLSKRWGPTTGAKLAELAATFPECKVTVREADPDI